MKSESREKIALSIERCGYSSILLQWLMAYKTLT